MPAALRINVSKQPKPYKCTFALIDSLIWGRLQTGFGWFREAGVMAHIGTELQYGAT
jgi:hypothetical protein